MARTVRIAGKDVRLPVFAPTIYADRVSWFWTYGFPPDAALISHDVVVKQPDLRATPLTKALGFDGLLIVDSGAYGEVEATDPAVVYRDQRAAKADVAVALDRMAHSTQPASGQWKRVRETVDNAATVVGLNRRRRTVIEGVVQGATEEQRVWCATRLSEVGVRIVGVPVSSFSKHRQYALAMERVLEVRSAVRPGVILHAMGAGSRTTIALLSYLGVEIFDSTSWVYTATRGERLRSVTMCVLGEPMTKAECAFCQLRPGRTRTTADRTKHNLREILKEVIRVRCAQDEDVMRQYVERRVRRSALEALRPLLDRASERPDR